MTEPERPTVYAYVDLAEQGRDASRTMWRVPTSSAPTGDWNGCTLVNSERLLYLREETSCVDPMLGVTFVRGAEALRVAEREVRETAADLFTCVSRPIVSNVVAKDGLLWIDFDGAGILDFASAKYPRLARAVKLRDRLRARLANVNPDHALYEKHECASCGRIAYSDPVGTDWCEACHGHITTCVSTNATVTREDASDRLGLPRDYVPTSIDFYVILEALRKLYDATEDPKTGLRNSDVAVQTHRLLVAYRDSSLPTSVNEIVNSLVKEKITMPIVNWGGNEPAKPDTHEECSLSLREGVLVDDYGRTLKGVWKLNGEGSGDRDLIFRRVACTIELFRDAIDSTCPPAARAPEPIILQASEPMPDYVRQRILDDFQRSGQSVILLPPCVRRAEPPEEERVRADVAHRADLAAASRRAWRWGLAVGAVLALVLWIGGLITVARVKPEWLARLAPRVSQQDRAPLTTPWSPAVLDEHALESESAEREARDAEGR